MNFGASGRFSISVYTRRQWIADNPTKGIDFFPGEKSTKYYPPRADILKVILAADPDSQDYLICGP